MVGQHRRRWATISPALGQRLVFDRLQDRKCWREVNEQTETDRADRGKAICLHLCVQRGDKKIKCPSDDEHLVDYRLRL